MVQYWALTQFLLAAEGSSMGPCTSSFFLCAISLPAPLLAAPLLWPSPGLVKKGLTSPVSALAAALVWQTCCSLQQPHGQSSEVLEFCDRHLQHDWTQRA